MEYINRRTRKLRITYNGKPVAIVDNGAEIAWFHNNTSYPLAYALKHGGYEIHEIEEGEPLERKP